MDLEEKNKPDEASRIFLQAWNEATKDFEKFIAAHYVTRHQKSVPEKLKWIEATLQLAQKINDDYVKGIFPSLYSNIATCYEELGDLENAKKNYELANSFKDKLSVNGPFITGQKLICMQAIC